jgi:hypothetical protein
MADLAYIEAHLPRGFHIMDREQALIECSRMDGVIVLEADSERLRSVKALYRASKREERQAPKCKLCKDSGLLHHLNHDGHFERRPCHYCDVYQGDIV